MPTLWTQTLIPTLRETPAEAEVPSHRLMLRAGLIRKLGSGSYSYLPLGLRSLRKAAQIVREEMDAAGAAEVLLPTLHPIELWEKTGRREAYGQNLFVVEDRHGRKAALGPTHEEVITDLFDQCVTGYRDLPKNLYQIQTKFRDEFRPRFGVLRSREFLMKDAYSFHLSIEGGGGLGETYDAMHAAYCRVFERCGVPYQVVEAEAGPIGGNASHEFMIPSPTGEDTILQSEDGTYAANVEKAEIGPRPVSETFGQCHLSDTASTKASSPPTGELEKVHTPGTTSIDELTAFFKKELKTKLKPQNTLKTLVYAVIGESRHVVAVVRGDHEVNPGKLARAVGGSIELIDPAAARDAGFSIGFVGPQTVLDKPDTTLMIDPDAAQDTFWVTGANEPDHHVKHFNWQRDLLDDWSAKPQAACVVADIRNATEGDPAPGAPHTDAGLLRETKGIEVGHIFKLGTKYTDALGVRVLNEKNEQQAVLMGCYGIGINRILAGAIETEGGSDDAGIRWPAAIAPYRVIITPIKYEGAVKEAACGLAHDLEAAGLDVLLDDRPAEVARPGVKFADADLIGIPLRIVVGDKGLAEDAVEFKMRDGSLGDRGTNVKLKDAVAKAVELVGSSEQ